MNSNMRVHDHQHQKLSRLEDFIGNTLTVRQQIRVESAVEELVDDSTITRDDWNRAFETTYFCVVDKSRFVGFRNHFSEKLLGIQQTIRNQGIDSFCEQFSPNIQRLAA